MSIVPGALPIILVLGLGVASGCGGPQADRPASDAKAEAKQPEDLGENVQRHIDEAAGGVRQAGERVEAGANKAADEIERAGERAHAGLDETKADSDEAKAKFLTQARQDLAKLDQDLRELEADRSAKGAKARAELRTARDRMQHRIDELDKQTGDAWKAAKTEVEKEIEKLRADIDAQRSS